MAVRAARGAEQLQALMRLLEYAQHYEVSDGILALRNKGGRTPLQVCGSHNAKRFLKPKTEHGGNAR